MSPHSRAPEVTDSDVAWAISTLGLDGLDEPRREFLKAQRTLDVSASPGSGKTTLLVAKLAILANKWGKASGGICVLSHTNAARQEIEQRLGGTPVGHRILAYPHFIGTIHAWANHFLALPSLYSEGRKITAIDNALAGQARLRALGRLRDRVDRAIQNPTLSAADIRFRIPEFQVYLGADPFPHGEATWSYRQAKRAVETSFDWGYYRHDEMLEYALALLARRPELPDRIARRFPVVLIDEMQDTSRAQNELIRLAFEEAGAAIVQRVGDPNQAIYDSVNASPQGGDIFPDADRERIELPNSYRFGPLIARVAQGFAAQALPPPGLRSSGPREWTGLEGLAEQPPTIIVFPSAEPQKALERFGLLVLDAVSDDEVLRSIPIAAVGHIHQPDPETEENDPKFPKSVSHYWRGYQPESITRPNDVSDLAGHFFRARAAALRSRSTQEAVNIAARGLIELARTVDRDVRPGRSTRTYRAIQIHLADNEAALAAFQELCRDLLKPGSAIDRQTWPEWVDRAITVASSLLDSGGALSREAPFLAWPERLPEDGSTNEGETGRVANAYRVQQGDRYVDIQLGSIHSVKGHTHLATLVLSTFWHSHFFKQLMPWLTGRKEHAGGEGPRNLQRLLLSYVAMTRPTHFLAVAVPATTIGAGDTVTRSRLEAAGWRVVDTDD